MTPNFNIPAYTNVQFTVNKTMSNPNGFLLPHILFDRIKSVATYPINDWFEAEPEISDYKFKMHKNALVNDRLTIQAQLIKKQPKKLLVKVLVTKRKKRSNTEETISSALFDFPLNEEDMRRDLAS